MLLQAGILVRGSDIDPIPRVLIESNGLTGRDQGIDQIRHVQPLVRGHAAWGLGRFPGSEGREALERALAREADEAVRDEIRLALDAIAT